MYAGLAFYLPKSKTIGNIFVTGALMFLIFSALPFSWNQGLTYFLYGLVVLLIFVVFSLTFNPTIPKLAEPKPMQASLSTQQTEQRHITAVIAMLSLSIAWVIN